MVNNTSQAYIAARLDMPRNVGNPPSCGTLPATPGQLYASRASTFGALPTFSMGALPPYSMFDSKVQEVREEFLQAQDEQASPACQRWVALSEHVLSNKRQSMLMEGKTLLRHDHGRLTLSEEQLSIYIFLNEASWISTFPKLAKRISNSLGSRLRQQAPTSLEASLGQVASKASSESAPQRQITPPSSASGGKLLDGSQLRERRMNEVSRWSRSLDVLPETRSVGRAAASCEFLPPTALCRSDSDED